MVLKCPGLLPFPLRHWQCSCAIRTTSVAPRASFRHVLLVSVFRMPVRLDADGIFKWRLCRAQVWTKEALEGHLALVKFLHFSKSHIQALQSQCCLGSLGTIYGWKLEGTLCGCHGSWDVYEISIIIMHWFGPEITSSKDGPLVSSALG